jgi:3-oxoacyl-[acyl-carrier protein] reductase
MGGYERVAIVTGGGRGIGRAAANALASDGIAVTLVARTESEVERAVADIRANGGAATAVVADVGDPNAAAKITAAAQERLGRCEMLVNAAGITGPVGELGEIDPSGWRTVLDVNLTGAFELCRAVLPAMREHRWGRIVNLISGLAHRVQPGLGAYSASKAALLHLSRVMDAENQDHGVRVFALEPGVVRSRMNEQLMSMDETGVRASVVEMLHALEKDPGFVTAEESAELIRLAATGRADHLAGEACSIYDPTVRGRLFAIAS